MKPSLMGSNNDREVKMETRKFSKKTIITILIVLCTAAISEATLVNSNSIVQDGIEYYIQTDKAVYDLGENVEILYRVTNLSDEAVMFVFAYQQQCFFEIWDDETRIWGWPKLVNPAFSDFTDYLLTR